MSNYIMIINTLLLAKNCEWSAWSFGECSKTCGDGTRTKTRTKLVTEENSGTCAGDFSTVENCMLKNCPGKIRLVTWRFLNY